jgi:hypothetical protein
MLRWRGRDGLYHEQVANACDSFVDLAPASEAPAALVRSRWAALLPGQDVPLIWERTTSDDCEDEGCLNC